MVLLCEAQKSILGKRAPVHHRPPAGPLTKAAQGKGRQRRRQRLGIHSAGIQRIDSHKLAGAVSGEYTGR